MNVSLAPPASSLLCVLGIAALRRPFLKLACFCGLVSVTTGSVSSITGNRVVLEIECCAGVLTPALLRARRLPCAAIPAVFAIPAIFGWTWCRRVWQWCDALGTQAICQMHTWQSSGAGD